MESMVAMIVCLLVVGYGWHMRSRQRQVISGWKQTKGRVVETGIKEEMRTPVGGAPGKWPMYSPLVRYRFKAGHQEHVGETIRLYDDVAYWFSDRRQAVSRGKRWRRGMLVTVYYNPADAGQSCLEAVTATPYLIMGFAVLWLVLIPIFAKIAGA